MRACMYARGRACVLICVITKTHGQRRLGSMNLTTAALSFTRRQLFADSRTLGHLLALSVGFITCYYCVTTPCRTSRAIHTRIYHRSMYVKRYEQFKYRQNLFISMTWILHLIRSAIIIHLFFEWSYGKVKIGLHQGPCKPTTTSYCPYGISPCVIVQVLLKFFYSTEYFSLGFRKPTWFKKISVDKQ